HPAGSVRPARPARSHHCRGRAAASRARGHDGRASRGEVGAMSMRGLVCALIGSLAAAACVSIGPLNVPHEGTAPEPEVPVMLRMPPPHFRPDMAYAGSYESSLGASARGRIADELAHRHHLMLVTRWPMPVLGVDCFVMRAPASDDVAEVARRL